MSLRHESAGVAQSPAWYARDGVHLRSVLKRLQRVVLHFVLHPQVISYRQTSGAADSGFHTTCNLPGPCCHLNSSTLKIHSSSQQSSKIFIAYLRPSGPEQTLSSKSHRSTNVRYLLLDFLLKSE